MTKRAKVISIETVLLVILAAVAVWRSAGHGKPIGTKPSETAVGPAPDGPTLSLDLGGGQTLELVRVPAGHFLMGSPDTEDGHDSSESPQHQVTIAKPFYVGKYEVTQGQFVQCTAAKTFEFKGDKLPAEEMNWDEAVWFCDNASKRTGRKVRLPTEAEWEYFARAGTTGPFWAGDKPTPSDANFGHLPGGPAPDAKAGTMPVGSFKPNGFGIYDTIGNVAEWCQDTMHDDYAKAPVDGSAWVTPSPDATRVCRGGAFKNDAASCRAAMRSSAAPKDTRNSMTGFRVVVEMQN